MVTTDLSMRCTGDVERPSIGLHRGTLAGSGRGTSGPVTGAQWRPWTPGALAAIRPAAQAAHGTAVPGATKRHPGCAVLAGASFADVAGSARRDDFRARTNPIPTDGVTSVSDLGPPV